MTVLNPIFAARTAVDLRTRIMTVKFYQKTAVDDTFLISPDMPVMPQACKIREASAFLLGAIAAAGESMAIDIKKNGVSCLTAKLTLSNGAPAAVRTEVPVTTLGAAGLITFAKGDVISADYDYTAGGGPTPLVGTCLVVILDPA